jgi:hypothetical protein
MAVDVLTKKQVESNTNDILRIRKVVFGNGDEGLDETVRSIETKLDGHIKIREKSEAKKEKIQLILLGTIASNVFIVLGAILAFFFKIYPILLKIESDSLVVIK